MSISFRARPRTNLEQCFATGLGRTFRYWMRTELLVYAFWVAAMFFSFVPYPYEYDEYGVLSLDAFRPGPIRFGSTVVSQHGQIWLSILLFPLWPPYAGSCAATSNSFIVVQTRGRATTGLAQKFPS